MCNAAWVSRATFLDDTALNKHTPRLHTSKKRRILLPTLFRQGCLPDPTDCWNLALISFLPH